MNIEVYKIIIVIFVLVALLSRILYLEFKNSYHKQKWLNSKPISDYWENKYKELYKEKGKP